MDLMTVIENIPPTFIGIVLGSFLTVLGVILTNTSNTRRLRLQHEHERALDEKTRDLNLRRDIYMDAMEAVSAGLVAVSRFSEHNTSPEVLMRSYTDLSPKIGKVIIVGTNETIEAMTTFNSEMTGVFMRLMAKREQFNVIHQQDLSIEKERNAVEENKQGLTISLQKAKAENWPKDKVADLHDELKNIEAQISAYKEEHEAIWAQLFPMQMELVQATLAEVARLDLLLVPLVGKMRGELGLSFDESFYREILVSGHKKLKNYLSSFFTEFDGDFMVE